MNSSAVISSRSQSPRTSSSGMAPITTSADSFQGEGTDSSIGFADFALSEKLKKNITAAGFSTPTPIQAQSIPQILQGKDILGLAQTGTGKTAAFVLPILEQLLQSRQQAPQTGPQQGRKVRNPSALIVAPTRELAEQINMVIRELGAGTGIRSLVIIGGVSQRPQAEQLKQGVDIIVACPGRLLDLAEQRIAKLHDVRHLVLDEADQMFDMGFLPSIRKILNMLPPARQNLLFSATMPREIAKLAEELLENAITVDVGTKTPVATVTHAIFPVASADKPNLLLSLLPELGPGSILIFTRTKHRTKRLGEQLDRAGYAATSLQGNLSHQRRKQAMDGFRNGSYQILVATDIAARGIDISSVTHVINFDVPETPEAYTHRIGRTGRAARTGDAFTFMSEEDVYLIRAIERKIGAPIQRISRDGFQAPDFDNAPQGPIPRNRGRRDDSRGPRRESRPQRRASDGRGGERRQDGGRPGEARSGQERRSEGRGGDTRGGNAHSNSGRGNERSGGGQRSSQGNRRQSSERSGSRPSAHY